MDFFEKNCLALSKGWPELYEIFEKKMQDDLNDEKLESIRWIPCHDEENVPVVSRADGKVMRIGSEYSPEHEAQVWARQFADRIQSDSFVYMLGMGGGQCAREMLQKLGEEGILVVYEPSVAVFVQGMEQNDWTDLLSDTRVRVIVDGINPNFMYAYLDTNLIQKNIGKLLVCSLSGYGEFYPQDMVWFLQKLQDRKENLLLNRNTTRRFLPNLMKQPLYNYQYMQGENCISRVTAHWDKRIPMVLISAGPSLEKNKQLLKKLAGRALRVATDTSLPSLLQAGIVPDAFINIDPQTNLAYFDNDVCKNIPMICSIRTSEALLQLHQGTKIFCRDEKFFESIKNLAGMPPISYQYGGCIATALYAMAAEAGIETLIFIGQDLAYAEDGTTHAGGYNEGVAQGQTYMVDGQNGQKIKSRHDWFAYLNWFENAIAHGDIKNVINATEGGAIIHGAMHMTFQEAIDTYCKNTYDIKSILETPKAKIKETEYERIGKMVEEAMQDIFWIRDLLKKVSTENVSQFDHEKEAIHQMPVYQLIEQYEMIVEECDWWEMLREAISYIEPGLIDVLCEKRKKILALIPARGGSKGVPGKNIRELAGRPLIAHTIEAAKRCRYVDRVIVSTDSQEIEEAAVQAGAEVPFLRPASLAADDSKTIDAVLYTIQELEKQGERYDYLVLLQPTSPLRTSEDICQAICQAVRNEKDVVGISPVKDSPILMRESDESGVLTPLLEQNSTVRRQDMPVYYRVNGSIYVNHTARLTKDTSFNDNPFGYIMPVERSIDIDEPADFALAEYYFAQREK